MKIVMVTAIYWMEQFLVIVIAIWRGGGVPQEWKDATIIVLHKKDRTECGNLSWHLARGRCWQGCPQGSRQSPEQQREDIPPEEQSDFRPQRSTIDTTFVVGRLYQLTGPKKNTPLFTWASLTSSLNSQAYDSCDSVDRTLLWTVLARFVVPREMLAVIRE